MFLCHIFYQISTLKSRKIGVDTDVSDGFKAFH